MRALLVDIARYPQWLELAEEELPVVCHRRLAPLSGEPRAAGPVHCAIHMAELLVVSSIPRDRDGTEARLVVARLARRYPERRINAAKLILEVLEQLERIASPPSSTESTATHGLIR